jgi:septal ring factor EnvC (AmiA/AmiB activator)
MRAFFPSSTHISAMSAPRLCRAKSGQRLMQVSTLAGSSALGAWRAAGLILLLFSIFLSSFCVGIARADDTESETDRLRDALRDALQQQRSLEDQRTTLQAQLTDMTRDRDRLSHDIDTYKARIKSLQTAYNTAVTEFNQHLEERNQVLEKWKAAYEDAADVARAKDAERAKYQAEATAYDAANKVCRDKNAKLVRVSSDILAGYRQLNMWKVLAAREPVIGYGGVAHESQVQAYLDRILDQKVQP